MAVLPKEFKTKNIRKVWEKNQWLAGGRGEHVTLGIKTGGGNKKRGRYGSKVVIKSRKESN